jgi:hypothetical protein
MSYLIFSWATIVLSIGFIFLLIASVKRKNIARQKKASILLAAISLFIGLIYLLGILNTQYIILGFIKHSWPWIHLSVSIILALVSVIKSKKNILGYVALLINICLLIFVHVISNDIQKIINTPYPEGEPQQGVTDSMSYNARSNKNQIPYFI